jgi:hypothetical protein
MNTQNTKRWLFPVLIGGVAVFVRVCNLGTFSLWLDEVFTMKVASLPLLETLSRCADDAENVPLYAVVTNLCLKAGLDDPWIRLVPIGAGVASIVFLSFWTCHHFGKRTALLVAGFCALSPFHIRYSQELRAYPYLLLVCALTLVTADRLRDRPDWFSTSSLAVIVALGCYTNLTYVLILPPVVGLVLRPRDRSRDVAQEIETRVRRRFIFGVALGLLAFAPWIWLIWSRLTNRISRGGITHWNIQTLGRRWEELTVAWASVDAATWLGGTLAVFFAAGVIVASRTTIGRFVLLPAIPTLIAWETLLVMMNHWSSTRYDTVLWPFIVILIVLGFEQILQRIRWRWLQGALCGAIVVAFLFRIDSYHRHGRPHWDLVAGAVRELQKPGEALVTFKPAARVCLGYYLGQSITEIEKNPVSLNAALKASQSLLLILRHPLGSEYVRPNDTFACLANVHRTAEVCRIQSAPTCQPTGVTTNAPRPRRWPEPVVEQVSARYQVVPTGCFLREHNRPPDPPSIPDLRIDLAASEHASLLSGWGRPTLRGDGETYRWVLGYEASIDLGYAVSTRHRIRIRLQAHPDLADTQWLRVVLNGHVIGQRRLGREWRNLDLHVPATVWQKGNRGCLVLQFSRACGNGGYDTYRPAAVNRIRIIPL